VIGDGRRFSAIPWPLPFYFNLFLIDAGVRPLINGKKTTSATIECLGADARSPCARALPRFAIDFY
jgi:hypothetical protein